MKENLLILAIIFITAGCTSLGNKSKNEVDMPKIIPIQNQNLSTKFNGDGITINWSCAKRQKKSLGITCEENKISSIEATTTVPSMGATNANAAAAIEVGQLQSMAMIVRFLTVQIDTSRVVKLMTENVEKANDKYRTSLGSVTPSTVMHSSSDDRKINEYDQDMNTAIRSNINSTIRDISFEHKDNASAVLRGITFDVTKEDEQLIQVTATWHRNLVTDLQMIQQYFE